MLQSFESIQNLLGDLQNISQSYMFTFNNVSVLEMSYVVCGGLPNMTGFMNFTPTSAPKTAGTVTMSPTSKFTTLASTVKTTNKALPLLFEKLSFVQSGNISTTSSTTKNGEKGNLLLMYNYSLLKSFFYF